MPAPRTCRTRECKNGVIQNSLPLALCHDHAIPHINEMARRRNGNPFAAPLRGQAAEMTFNGVNWWFWRGTWRIG
jgi:hypothetical protein